MNISSSEMCSITGSLAMSPPGFGFKPYTELHLGYNLLQSSKTPGLSLHHLLTVRLDSSTTLFVVLPVVLLFAVAAVSFRASGLNVTAYDNLYGKDYEVLS